MKLKRILLCFTLFTVLIGLVSCGNSNKAFEQAEKNGCTISVIFDFGNGTSNGNSEALLRVSPNAIIPKPGAVSIVPAPILVGSHLVGYFIRDDSGNETEWDFAKDRVPENVQELTLYAKWEKNVEVKTYSVQIFYGENNENSYSLNSFTSAKPTLASFRKQEWYGHTFYGFYYDAEYTRPVEFPYTHGLSDENPVETVYAKYLDGIYTIICTASDFGGRIEAGARYYLDADIVVSGVVLTIDSDFSGAFIGNGHTISGLSVTKNQQRVINGYGLFNSISSGAVFRDITFADVSVNVVLNNTQNTMINYVGGFAGLVNAGAVFDNVSFSGTLTCNKQGRTFEEGTLIVATEGPIGECDPSVSLESFVTNLTVNIEG